MLSSLGTGTRRLLLVAVLLLAAALAGTAASGASQHRHTFTISGGVAGLHPGGTRTASLRIHNYYPWRIAVRSISVRSSRSSRKGCAATVVTSPGWHGSRRVRRGGATTIRVPVRMSAKAPGACQRATFTLLYHGSGVRP